VINEQTIEQIAAANDIVDVIGSYFPLKRAGATWKALCPFHNERSPSFTVNPHRQIFKCFGCGAGGSVFRFVMQYESVDFISSVKRLAERAGITIVEDALSPSDDRRLRLRKRIVELHAAAADWFHEQLIKSPGAAAARTYLKSRGINSTIAKAWKIGYAPDAWDALGDWARTSGYHDEEIVRSGLVKLKTDEDVALANADAPLPRAKSYDRFRHRVMFPICDDTGKVVAFSGRILTSDQGEAKYVNSPETMLFTKGNILFGLHKSKRALIDKSSAIVCEGQLDLITAFEAGVENVIAPQGTAFTEKQARILKRYVEEVILCFDADAAGVKAAERSLPALLGLGLFVKVATMPPGQDPDSLIRSQGAEAFRERISAARDFFDDQLDRAAALPDFRTPRTRSALTRKLAAFVGLIEDVVTRDAVVHRLSSRLEVAPLEIRRMLKRAKGKPVADTEDKPDVTELDRTMRMLCTIALRDPSGRQWLVEAAKNGFPEDEPSAALLGKILRASLDMEAHESVGAFLGALPADEEAALSELLIGPPIKNSIEVASDCWRELCSRTMKRGIDAIQARIRGGDLPLPEISNLHKEMLDLQKRLSDIPRPFPGT